MGTQRRCRFQERQKLIAQGLLASTPVKVRGHFGLAYDRPRLATIAWTPWRRRNIAGQWAPYDLWDIEPGDQGRQGRARVTRRNSIPLLELYADTAAEMIGKLAKQPDPFFLYVAWNCPHDPRQAPKEYLDLYPAEKIEVPPNYLSEHPFDIGANGQDRRARAPFRALKEIVQIHRQEYYALATYMDTTNGSSAGCLRKNRARPITLTSS